MLCSFFFTRCRPLSPSRALVASRFSLRCALRTRTCGCVSSDSAIARATPSVIVRTSATSHSIDVATAASSASLCTSSTSSDARSSCVTLSMHTG